MNTTSPTPRGTRTATRPLLTAAALSALLLLSACGSSDDTANDEASGTASGSPSASSSASPSSSATSASPTPSSSEKTAQAAEASKAEPKETRKASAPEAGMPSASPFDKEKADAQAAGVCNPSQLSGSAAPEQGAAGHTIVSLTLTNTGSTPCTLDGYAGVSFTDANGAPVGAPASREGAGPGAVTLQPGASASAGLSITQPGVIGQVCNPQAVTGLRVYPPGSYDSLVVSYPVQACGNPKVSQLQVTAFGA
ncbi:DUF4232 domain-containing protein [Kocuria varians]|nr:DUF4232 domain-containing protein [Kocuria varians]